MPAVRLLMLSMQLLKKADYCDTRIEKFITTAKLYFCIELQDFELMMNDV